MAYRDEDLIYVLTREDVVEVAHQVGVKDLTEDHYRMAQKYMESFCGGGSYTWFDAIAEALRDAEAERRTSDSNR